MQIPPQALFQFFECYFLTDDHPGGRELVIVVVALGVGGKQPGGSITILLLLLVDPSPRTTEIGTRRIRVHLVMVHG